MNTQIQALVKNARRARLASMPTLTRWTRLARLERAKAKEVATRTIQRVPRLFWIVLVITLVLTARQWMDLIALLLAPDPEPTLVDQLNEWIDRPR